LRHLIRIPRVTLIRAVLALSGMLLAGDSLAQRVEALAFGNSQAAGNDNRPALPLNGCQTPGPALPTATGTDLSDHQRTNDGKAFKPSNLSEQIAIAGNRTSLDIVTPRAEAHINYALELAQRGAVESAQAEFRTALELIADALDADTNNAARAHARAVKAGLTAIEEAKDFVSADTVYDVETNLSQFAVIHHTPVLKEPDAIKLTRAAALQRYHTYATAQLAFAGGHSAIASNALYGLGRAESTTTAGTGARNPLGGPNAIALYQAALYVDPQNYIASNELGVLMARYGDLSAAEEQFIHSLNVHPQPETWHNLAAVYRTIGQNDKAGQAENERQKLIAATREGGAASSDANGVASRPMLRWVDAETFAASSTPYGLDGPAISSSTSTKAVTSGQPGSIATRLLAKLTAWPRSSKTTPTDSNRQPDQQVDSSHGIYTAEQPLYR
jgi:tetratricopeptide (TPR) repeat protein